MRTLNKANPRMQKRRGRFSLCAVFVFSALACLSPPLAAAELRWKTIAVGGVERRFLVDRPDRPTEAKPALLLVLHGAFSNPDDMRRQGGFDRLANRDDFVFVFPKGTGPKASDLTWNAGFCCRSAMRRAVDDVSFLDAVVETVAAQMSIDHRRVFVSGISNGALLAYRWGALRADKVAGIAAVAGAIGGRKGFFQPEVTPADPAHPVSVLIFHARDDPYFPYGGGISLRLLLRLPGRASISVADAVAFWTRADGCTGTPMDSPADRQGVSVISYRQCRAGTEVEVWTIDRLGHDWPPPLARLSEPEHPEHQALFAAYMVDFFRRHPKRDLDE
jgi:polyhydroxybutyrate depolymerase